MTTGNHNYNGEDHRALERRVKKDRRSVVRFDDTLGRRSGVERRLVISD